MNIFIDTHSHVDMGDFVEDFPEMLAKCDEVGVKKVIIPGVNQEDEDDLRIRRCSSDTLQKKEIHLGQFKLE